MAVPPWDITSVFQAGRRAGFPVAQAAAPRPQSLPVAPSPRSQGGVFSPSPSSVLEAQIHQAARAERASHRPSPPTPCSRVSEPPAPGHLDTGPGLRTPPPKGPKEEAEQARHLCPAPRQMQSASWGEAWRDSPGGKPAPGARSRGALLPRARPLPGSPCPALSPEGSASTLAAALAAGPRRLGCPAVHIRHIVAATVLADTSKNGAELGLGAADPRPPAEAPAALDRAGALTPEARGSREVESAPAPPAGSLSLRWRAELRAAAAGTRRRGMFGGSCSRQGFRWSPNHPPPTLSSRSAPRHPGASPLLPTAGGFEERGCRAGCQQARESPARRVRAPQAPGPAPRCTAIPRGRQGTGYLPGSIQGATAAGGVCGRLRSSSPPRRAPGPARLPAAAATAPPRQPRVSNLAASAALAARVPQAKWGLRRATSGRRARRPRSIPTFGSARSEMQVQPRARYAPRAAPARLRQTQTLKGPRATPRAPAPRSPLRFPAPPESTPG
ncbi:basic proline-rich protein-like [Choloepus didactylus]|uniref:basic proline-rich protein-like n=1 Tax=Choloepus didactylus TaxID=27675 RepID=UPI00189C9D85|nr:basic proline-rich protein-like [Choloepus didactylus]